MWLDISEVVEIVHKAQMCLIISFELFFQMCLKVMIITGKKKYSKSQSSKKEQRKARDSVASAGSEL